MKNLLCQLKARFHRWAYLVSSGMWRGEQQVDYRSGFSTYCVAVHRPGQTERVFWLKPGCKELHRATRKLWSEPSPWPSSTKKGK